MTKCTVVRTNNDELEWQSAQWFLYLKRGCGAVECTVVHTYSEEVRRQSAEWFIPTAKRWGDKVHSGSYLQRRGGMAKCTVVNTYSEEVGR
jgi:hypothetical protein